MVLTTIFKKYEPEYQHKDSLNTVQEEILVFILQKIANGKRLDELLLLKDYGIKPSENRIRTIYKVLTNNYVPSEPQKKF